MNRLQGYSRDLRAMFEDTLTVRHVASSLASFDAERTAHKIRTWMAGKDFDHIGVRRDGIVVGYAMRTDLQAGCLGDHCRAFTDEDVVSGDLGLLESLEVVRARRAVYVRVLGDVHGIVTAGDAVRPAVRLWLFGLMTIGEMQLTRLIRRLYPDDAWISHVKPQQVGAARSLLKQRKQNGTDADLMDCLTLGAKHGIVAATPLLRDSLALGDEATAKATLARVAALRNQLAHADDISGAWPDFLGVARAVEDMTRCAEQLSSRDLPPLVSTTPVS